MSLISGGIVEQPITRFSSVSRELRKAVHPDASGGLVANPGYVAPEWLSLVVADRHDRVVYSNLAGIHQGEGVDGGRVSALARGEGRSGSPSGIGSEATELAACSYAETVEWGGKVLGSYYAILPPLDLRGTTKRDSSIFRLVILALLSCFAVVAGAGVSAMLARSVMRLEKAAQRIASGDLDTEVRIKGIREMVALADTMDGMRKTLREDRDQRARFLASVSHDLRTPLTSIGGYLEAVEDGLAEDPETLKRYVEIMHAKERLLETRIQGLLEFARMETGEWRAGFERLELEPFLTILASEFAEDAGLSGQRLEYRLSASAGIAVMADRDLLRRAFENLLSNALRYSPPGSLVALSARRDTSPATGVGLFIEVDDSGPGIPEADRARVFEAFYRGSGAREGAGNGLGLYIAHSVLRDHGWGISVSAAPSGGARFTVFIPRAVWLA
jgi:signal transduction histidine kinase